MIDKNQLIEILEEEFPGDGEWLIDGYLEDPEEFETAEEAADEIQRRLRRHRG